MPRVKPDFERLFAGTSAADTNAQALSRKFLDKVRDPFSRLNLSDADNLIRRRGKPNLLPSAARDGNGLTWLKQFLDYKGDECLLFPYGTGAQPTGTVTYNFKRMPSHRAMCFMVHKRPPEGKELALHKCGNGHLGCVNPNHLYWGDHSDNCKDAHRHVVEGKNEVPEDSRQFASRARRLLWNEAQPARKP